MLRKMRAAREEARTLVEFLGHLNHPELVLEEDGRHRRAARSRLKHSDAATQTAVTPARRAEHFLFRARKAYRHPSNHIRASNSSWLSGMPYASGAKYAKHEAMR